MTARRQPDHHGTGWSEADPVGDAEWRETSTRAVREQTLRDCAKAVREAKERGGRA